jgi:hypothetical protein
MAMMGASKRITRVFQLLMEKGPSMGYFPEATKSYHICPKEEEAEARAAFEAVGIHVNFCCGKHYVGGFIGSEAILEQWLEPKVRQWVEGVEILAHIASRFPQTAYAGLVTSLQAKWQYICHVVLGVEHYLGTIKSAICEKFIPALLQVSNPVDNTFCQLLSQGVKMGGLALRNPTTSAPLLLLVKALHALARGIAGTAGLRPQLKPPSPAWAAFTAYPCPRTPLPPWQPMIVRVPRGHPPSSPRKAWGNGR